VNRRPYTLQSDRPHAESGRHYYFRPSDKKTGHGLSLTPDTLRGHIEGEITIALYAINPATQRCKWVAIDADYKNALTDLIKLGYYLKQDGVESALEKSNRGGHLWIFMADPLPARDCRIYVYDLALRLGVPVKGGGLTLTVGPSNERKISIFRGLKGVPRKAPAITRSAAKDPVFRGKQENSLI